MTFITVTTRVMSIVVNTLDRVSPRGFVAHVRKEIGKRCAPVLTDLDATLAVCAILRTIHVITSTAHITPRHVERVAFGQSVSSVEGADLLISQTPAASYLGTMQIALSHFCDRATIAFAPPLLAFTLTAPGIADNGQSDESLPCNVNEIMCGWKGLKFNVIFVVVHSSFSFIESVWARAVRETQSFVWPVHILAHEVY